MTFSLSSWSWLLELPNKEIFVVGACAFADGALTFPGNAQLNDPSQLAAIRRSDMSYQQKRFYLFNCDNTYSLETVQKLLLEAGDKYGFKISVDRLCFGLQRMAEVCDRSLPHLVMDYAIFVVHADESRLSINEDNAGIGYARLYRALLQKTGGF